MILNHNIIENFNYLKYIAKKTLKLISLHTSESQILIKRIIGTSVSIRNGELENIEFHNDDKIKITVFHKNSKGYVTSNNIQENNISNIVSKAINIAKHTSPDLYSCLANKLLLSYCDLDLDLFHPHALNLKYIINLVTQTEKIALKYDKRIVHTEGANFNNYISTKIIANTHGLLQGYNSTYYSLSCGVVAEGDNGTLERNYAFTVNRSFKKLDSSFKIGKQCANRTLQHLNPKKISTTESSVLFSAEIATSLFNHLIHAINGENVYKKSTFLLHNLGTIIFPHWLCIKEYPHILSEIASAPFDDEGVRSNDRIIVKNGMLCTWLLDTYSANKLNLDSTGHANKIYNWYVNYQKNTNFSNLIKKMNTGLIITDLMGQGVNIVTGDYSRGASGFWIENGEIRYPVSEITISGNLKEMFLNIISIGNDIENRSNIKCGSVLLSPMKVSGK